MFGLGFFYLTPIAYLVVGLFALVHALSWVADNRDNRLDLEGAECRQVSFNGFENSSTVVYGQTVTEQQVQTNGSVGFGQQERRQERMPSVYCRFQTSFCTIFVTHESVRITYCGVLPPPVNAI